MSTGRSLALWLPPFSFQKKDKNATFDSWFLFLEIDTQRPFATASQPGAFKEWPENLKLRADPVWRAFCHLNTSISVLSYISTALPTRCKSSHQLLFFCCFFLMYLFIFAADGSSFWTLEWNWFLSSCETEIWQGATLSRSGTEPRSGTLDLITQSHTLIGFGR